MLKTVTLTASQRLSGEVEMQTGGYIIRGFDFSRYTPCAQPDVLIEDGLTEKEVSRVRLA